MKNKKKKGFTLIELIAVIAILAVLAAIAIPNVIRYIDNAKAVSAKTEASTIYNTAAAAYNDGQLKGVTTQAEFDQMQVGQFVKENESLFTNKPNEKVIAASDTMANLVAIMNENKDSITFDSNGAVVVPQGTTAN